MITRAHIRRQLRASGGITNAMNGSIGGGIIQGNPMGTRTGYFNPFKAVKKGLSKVVDVAKQVVKSPVGKAALIGLGGAGLMGMGPLAGLGGIGAKIGGFGKTMLGSFASQLGPQATSGSGLLGLLGRGKSALSNMSGLTKMLGAGGLIGYFASKGASEEEAKELAQDVYRGKGIGFDQIRADLNKYRSGDLSQQQMFDKNYRFLTPRNFIGAAGGRVGLRSGGDPLPEDPTKPVNPFQPKPTGPVLPNKMAEIPKGLSMQDAVKTFTLSNGRKPKNVQEVIDFFKNRKLSAQGGRIGYDEGSNSIDFKVEKELKDKAPGSYKLFGGGALSPLQHMLRYLTKKRMEKEEKNKNKKADGGIMNMPMGNMRRNRAGVMERDYRDKGGFVPVGVKEKADDVPAMLSKNEFVMTADAVRGAGDGNIKKGAQRMYDLMKRNEGKVA